VSNKVHRQPCVSSVPSPIRCLPSLRFPDYSDESLLLSWCVRMRVSHINNNLSIFAEKSYQYKKFFCTFNYYLVCYINYYFFIKLGISSCFMYFTVLILLSILELCNCGNNICVNLQQRKKKYKVVTTVTSIYILYWVLLEGTTAKVNGASDHNIQSWTKIANILLEELRF